ncbi:transporter substrate-binding domain-containing protein [Pseudomonas sp. TMP25]|uniref:substrate-binding periplasmic protein n=1 Tax=Pseudomonas sp. TMP25 TaxID=3136561 RepID=UPI0031015C67
MRYDHVWSLLLCLLMPVASADEGILRLTTHDLPPYSYRDPADERLRGIAVEVVVCVLDRIGTPYDIQVLPWARAQKLVKSGGADGFFAGSRNEERDAFAVSSAVIAEQQWRWYLLTGNPTDPLSAGFRENGQVSSFIGANMLDWLGENGYRVAVPPRDTIGLLNMLRAGRIEAILANNLVMDKLISEQALEGTLRSVLQQNKPLGIYFSKKFIVGNPGFLQRFNNEVEPCRGFSEGT